MRYRSPHSDNARQVVKELQQAMKEGLPGLSVRDLSIKTGRSEQSIRNSIGALRANPRRIRISAWKYEQGPVRIRLAAVFASGTRGGDVPKPPPMPKVEILKRYRHKCVDIAQAATMRHMGQNRATKFVAKIRQHNKTAFGLAA